ncbi:3'-5' exonuclease [Cytobacillus sp. Hz8]|uniref:3'-5' exonuclease n=1 Tax=Cytobacillus sp. Hz8 TaxID=3347168 RepID=UPI0035E22EC9
MNIVALDFETANSARSSVCSIGIVEYQNGKLIDEYYSLVKPKKLVFYSYNVYVHGITAEDVQHSPEFDELWDNIQPRLENKLVIAHNASFDLSVLRGVLDEYNIPYPTLSYNCSVNIAKKTWPGLSSYKLNVISSYLGITFQHHHALEDAHAAAQIYLKAYELIGATSHEDLRKKLSISQGQLDKNGYTPARINAKKIKSI